LKLIIDEDAILGIKYINGAALPKRAEESHKYNYGCDMVVGGCIGYTGAPMYSAEAASKIGAGLCMLGVPESIYEIEATKAVSCMPFPLPDEKGTLSYSAYSPLSEKLKKCDALLIGPGMGQSEGTKNLTLELIRTYEKQIILDADGINAASSHIDCLRLSKKPLIITPHMGEFLRLGGNTDLPPIESAKAFAVGNRCILVLKGHRTVTAFPDGDVFVNTTGSPCLAKGGSGDVLAGMILGLVGQGFSLKAAVPGAVFLHGLAGDICEKELTEYCVLPTDVINAIPKALKLSMR